MVEEKLEKIIEFFNDIECPIKNILKNNLKDEDNPYDYYIINEGEDILLNDKKYGELLKFGRLKKISILTFYLNNCEKGLIEEFKSDGYQIIYET